jgi:UDP-N-acetylglucosamine 2-epimerase (non-hydrolysing)/GDP/UDP-N,N'-diacetylbacillosamine 2-epimerase (hydrolysing)
MDPQHGETWREIANDGFEIEDKITGRVAGDSSSSMSASVGLYLYGMSQAMARHEPDILLVLGDRGEQLAGAMAAAFANVVVVHLCGGSQSGSIDDSIRHAITKFAHYHLPAFDEHARRIMQMGEEPSSVQVVGLPGGDLREDVAFSREQICDEYGLPQDKPYLLVVQHPVTHSASESSRQIVETLEAVAQSDYPALLANPNDDAGGRAILARMREYAEIHPNLRILPPPGGRERFASIMAHAGALIGNSSSGVVEAMSVGLPVVNIGDRQRGREHLAVWLNVEYDQNLIRQAIESALHDPHYRSKLTDFARKIHRQDTPTEVVKFLRSIDLSVSKKPKRFVDLSFAEPSIQTPDADKE